MGSIKKKTVIEHLEGLIEFYKQIPTSDEDLKKLIIRNLQDVKRRAEKEKRNMIIEKDNRLKNKAREDDYGNTRHCRICNKPIYKDDIDKGEFEYVKSKINENYFHAKCVKELKKIKDRRIRNDNS